MVVATWLLLIARFVPNRCTRIGAKQVVIVAVAKSRANNIGPSWGLKVPRPACKGNMGNVAAEQLACPNRRAAQCLKIAFFGGLGPEGAALTAAIKRRTDDAPAEEFIESRRRQDKADVLVERQEIGEYAAICCKLTLFGGLNEC